MLVTFILITINNFFRVVCRGRIVYFPHPLEYNLQSTTTINEIFAVAPAAGPAIVDIGNSVSSMEPSELREIQLHISEVLPELDSRGVIEYSLLLASALKV